MDMVDYFLQMPRSLAKTPIVFVEKWVDEASLACRFSEMTRYCYFKPQELAQTRLQNFIETNIIRVNLHLSTII